MYIVYARAKGGIPNEDDCPTAWHIEEEVETEEEAISICKSVSTCGCQYKYASFNEDAFFSIYNDYHNEEGRHIPDLVINHLAPLERFRELGAIRGFKSNPSSQWIACYKLAEDISLCQLVGTNPEREHEVKCHVACSPAHFAFLLTDREKFAEEYQVICKYCQEHPDYRDLIGMAVLAQE